MFIIEVLRVICVLKIAKFNFNYSFNFAQEYICYSDMKKKTKN